MLGCAMIKCSEVTNHAPGTFRGGATDSSAARFFATNRMGALHGLKLLLMKFRSSKSEIYERHSSRSLRGTGYAR
jgi:hypothetical protein